MSEPGFASLSPALLARKGGAKPAMRPQNTAGVTDGATAAANLEDLGWNDMGDDTSPTPARVVRMARASEATPIAPAQSPVRATLEAVQAKLAATANIPARTASASALRRDSRRAAFTLRLDQERHLKLRLACTVRGRSAQQIVTDALDDLLAQMPEIDSLAAQVLGD